TKYYSAVKGKTKLNQVKYICTVFILSSFITAQPADKNQSITFYSGAGIPVLGLNDWYGATPIYGMQYAYQGNDETDIIFEFHYQKYNHGAIEDRKFKWIVDYNYYLSSDANANMIWNDFIVKTRKYIHDKSISVLGNNVVPSFSYGIGFYNYTHRVKGLIYPGQYSQPLNEDMVMDPVTDRRVAWGGNLGIGGNTILNESMDLHFSLNYHAVIGYLRAFEDWGLYEVVPLQFLTFELGIAYKY
ncbi:MAG TPA: hypothetical protein QGF17_00960, partial [Candidatus Marinimicrobia bacterium]|nr:hypothetical protein [Candidatus Neomarinimicrobiota bacterium]